MKKKTISTTIATGLLLAPMALGLVANQAPAATVHAATSTIAKTSSNNALANWTANTPSHIKQQIQSQGIDPSNAKAAIYTIQWGDTLWGISQATGITIDQLATDNHIANRDLIVAGAKLTLNGSAKVQAFVQNAPGQSAESKASVSGAGSAAARTTGAATGTTTTATGTTTGAAGTAAGTTAAGTSSKAGTSTPSTTPSGTESTGSGVTGGNTGATTPSSEGSSAVTPSTPSTTPSGTESTGSGVTGGNTGATTPSSEGSSAVTPSTPSTGSGAGSSAASGSSSSSSASEGSSSAAQPSTGSGSQASSGSSSAGSSSAGSSSSASGSSSSASTPSQPSTGSGSAGSGSSTPSQPSTPTVTYADVTVKAVTSDGTVLKTATISHQEVGKSVTAQASSVAVSGYDLNDSASKSATVTKSGAVITFTYKKHETPAPAGKTYTPNVDHIKQLVMAKYNLASHGKYWGKPVGTPGDNGSIVGADGHLYLATPETWPTDSNPYTSDEQIAEAIWETRVTQALDDPNNVSAVIDTLTATGSTTINPNGTVSGKIQTYMHLTWYQKF
ncbi:peptidoglycan-binding LysM [Lacticaseibacillus rhamnosus]|uniref:LysM peptidoglycan-binding domain-containing protein n=1 Tax=Lacticaseibacillus rhamnosus TaxID=47715 RepID=UPI0005E620FD|nr:LysM domain-containing protein [Lacticaseibacillus rhamnosus]CDN23463.1 peptidoglycan-binding LysM [Lacticaseibacillus rhamnosus]